LTAAQLPNSTNIAGTQLNIHGNAIILESRSYAGMFSDLDNVWAVLDCYHARICSAIKIDFGTTGAYYDRTRGPNWFNYYFLPVELGESKAEKTVMDWLRGYPAREKEFIKTDDPMRGYLAQHHPDTSDFSRAEIAALWNKYVKLRPEIENEVSQIVHSNFDGSFVFGVHYRGTDKISEAPRVKYEKVAEAIKHQAAIRHLSHFKIFVATDEQGFIDYFQAEFPREVVYLSDTERSKDGKPLHLAKEQHQYKMGKAALLDSLLLSRVNLLIRTSSNLSRWSTYFNPELSVIELSRRHNMDR
jgi:hypothetical protein